MTDNKEVDAEDTSSSTPQEGSEEPMFQLADTSDDGPIADADDSPSELIFGKYKTMEEAERGYKEAEHMGLQAKEEVSTLSKAIQNFSQTPQMPQAPAPDNEAMNEQLRGHLETNPFPTLMSLAKMAIQQEKQVENQAKSQMMGEFKKFASDPAYQGVAQEVWQDLQFEDSPNVEMAFLRKKVSQLSNSQNTQSTPDDPTNSRMFAETGSGKPPVKGITVELSEDARRVQGAFGDSNEDFIALNKRVAQRKVSGGRDKAPVSIDDWIAEGGGK